VKFLNQAASAADHIEFHQLRIILVLPQAAHVPGGVVCCSLQDYVQILFTSMIVIVLFLGGVILLAVGLIGEYVGRIYIGQNQAPQCVIKEKTWKTSIEENSNGAADH